MRPLTAASHLSAVLALAALTRRLGRNLRFLRRARRLARSPDNPPLVSVLVPARDEAETVAACLESLAAQSYPRFEVIALDDQSSDGTGAILDEMAARHAHVTALHGAQAPPAGWNGKSFACQRLADQARGEWLLFTDADTLHAPDSLAQGVALAAGLGVDLLSAFPRQITVTWGERVLVSFIMDFLPLVGADLNALWRGEGGHTVANGQYLLVRAETYRATGGHRAIAPALVDDFALMGRFRSRGHRVALVDGTPLLRCRMYHSAGEVWRGFSKNILLGLETSAARPRPRWWAPLFAWGYASVFVSPFHRAVTSRRRGLPLLEIGWLGALRGVVAWRLKRPWTEIPTTPLAAWSVMALGLSALVRRRHQGRVTWKGRAYWLTR